MLRCASRQIFNPKRLFLIPNVCQSTEASAVEDPKLHHSSTITQRGRPKIPKKEPLVKNFLIGEVDKELLAFPEVIPRDDYAKLKDNTWEIANYFENNTSHIDLASLQSLGLFGLNIPQIQGGKGYFFSESLLIAEHENVSTSLGALFSSHRSVIDAICQCGTDLQKEKYLNKLANGSIVATEAVYEMKPSNDDLFNTKAVYDVDKDSWILNGEKVCPN